VNRSVRKALIVTAGFLCVVAVTDAAAQTRIRFAKGRTSAIVSGSLARNKSKTYVLRAKEGQLLTANVNSENKCVSFKPSGSAASFTTVKGDNLVILTNTCRRRGAFVLTVSISYIGT
jgi:hypothetical protein